MKMNLQEALPALIPEYPVEIAGNHLTLRFDVNINKTKKGVKLQFVMKDIPSDPRQAQQLANEIGTELQQKFADAGLQIIYDVENPYKNVVGFLLPLPSLANYIIKNIFQADVDQPEAGEEEGGEEEAPAQPLPQQEQPPVPEDEPVKEVFMKRAGLK